MYSLIEEKSVKNVYGKYCFLGICTTGIYPTPLPQADWISKPFFGWMTNEMKWIPLLSSLTPSQDRKGLSAHREDLSAHKEGLSAYRKGLYTYRGDPSVYKEGLGTYEEGLSAYREGLSAYKGV